MKQIKYIAIVAVVLLTASCKKFLEEKPTNFITPESALSSVKVAQAFTNSAYQTLQASMLGGQPSSYGGNTWNLMEFMTGKSNSDLGQTNFNLFQNLNYNATSFYVDTWWQNLYKGVGYCNQAIQSIPGINASGLSADAKTNMLAEVHTLRALYYFFLVRMYGAVPNVTTVPTDVNALNVSRSPAKNIYDSIILPDLLLAEKSTLPWKDNTGRISMGAVKSILADVYLTYAGKAINGGAANYALSAQRSLDVITKGGYTLFPQYTDMNKPGNKNSGEFIFQVQYSVAATTSNPLTPLTVPNYSKVSKYADEYGSVYPTPQFVASFPAGDKRAQERQFFYTSYPNAFTGVPVIFKGPYIYKWFDSTAIMTTKSDLNYSLYRYADVLLLYAEAQNRADGSANAASIKAVNDIRARATLAPIGALSQDAFEKEVWLQRYFELCFENKMWFDMLRTRKVHNDVTGNWDDFVGHKTVFNATFAEKQLLFPVPKQETDVNPNLLPNNTGF
ncbi:MAG: RagB/SusD family nutrient uptake outer membrane protein [Bacteroidota bacterium]